MKTFIAPLAVMLLAGIAPLAQANMQITYEVDGGAPVTCIGTDVVTCANDTGLVTGLRITGLSGNSNLTGEPSLALAAGSNTILSSVDGAQHTIHIDVVATGFIIPLAPPSLEFNSSVGGSVAVSSASNSLSFRSCVDTSGSLNGCPGTPGVAPFLSATLTPAVTSIGAYAATAPTQLITALLTGYALDEQLDVVVGANGRLGFSGTTTLTPVPEPMSIALLGGVVLLTSRLIRRKRSEVS
jgi:hypothetical protein